MEKAENNNGNELPLLEEEEDLDDIVEKSTSRVKSIEEIRSHTIDTDTDPFTKTHILLKSAYEAQLICGLSLLPQLLQIDPDKTIHLVFPTFKEICFMDDLNRSQDFYQSLNQNLLKTLTDNLLTSNEFAYHFVDLIAEKIYLYCDKPTDYETYAISQLWVQLMIDAINLLDEVCVKEDVFDKIPRMKLQFASRRTREYVAMILSKIAPKLSHQTLQNQLFPVLLDLCNDTQYEVRAIACQTLAPVCKLMGPDLTMNMVVPEMSTYLCDESVLVKTSCFQSLIDTLEIFCDEEDAQHYLFRKIQSFIDYGLSTRDEHYLITISKNIGKIVIHLNGIMNGQAKSSFIGIFAQICRDENLYARRSINEANFIWCKCKINLANAFPDVLQICNSVSYENKLSICLTSLIRDKHEQVREAIVVNIVSIAKNLGSSEYFRIITDYCASLTDDSTLVLNSSINQLESFIALFIKAQDSQGILPESQQMPGCQLVTKRLIKLEESTSHTFKYALHVKILQAFELLPWVLCTDSLIDDILPVLDKRSNCRALPVRIAAIKSMLIILRKVPRFQVRNFYFTKLIEEFSLNSNCYKRSIFIEISRLVLTLYSRNFFKQNFYKPLLKLAKDPVINVRIAFIKLLADLKRLWKTTDRDKLENLEVVARGLLNDKDRDVSELAFRAITQMDYIRTHINNDNEERANRVKDKEELILMDLEPKKSSSNLSKTHSAQLPEIRKKSDLSKSSSTPKNHYQPTKSAGYQNHNFTKSSDFGSRSNNSNPVYSTSGQLTDTYNIKEKKREVLMHGQDVPLMSVKTKRSGERRSSLNSENYNHPSLAPSQKTSVKKK